MRNLWCIVLLLPGLGSAQVWQRGIGAQLDTTHLRIGEQATLTLHVDYRSSGEPVSIQWPVIGDTLSKHVEVVHDSGIDTLRTGGEQDPSALRQLRQLTLTSFDTGYWAIPPFQFQVNGVDMETVPMLLEVKGVAVDTARGPNDIRDIYEAPFSWVHWARERWVWFAAGAGALLVAALIILLVRRRPKKEALVPLAPAIPLHERILQALHDLEKERLWQQGAHKEYQSRLTDLLRAYIEERYQVPALERTTDELLAELKVSPLSADQRHLLSNMLHSADMVKFAKALPAPAENEQLMAGAIRFVHETAAAEHPSVQSQPQAHAR